jgi:hypothetical protein
MRRREFYCEEIDARTEVTVKYTSPPSPSTTTEAGADRDSGAADAATTSTGPVRRSIDTIYLIVLAVAAAAVACLFTGDVVSLVFFLPAVALLAAAAFFVLRQ